MQEKYETRTVTIKIQMEIVSDSVPNMIIQLLLHIIGITIIVIKNSNNEKNKNHNHHHIAYIIGVRANFF